MIRSYITLLILTVLLTGCDKKTYEDEILTVQDVDTGCMYSIETPYGYGSGKKTQVQLRARIHDGKQVCQRRTP